MFSQNISQIIDKTIKNYIDAISKKYKIPPNELQNLWSGRAEVSPKNSEDPGPPQPPQPLDDTPQGTICGQCTYVFSRGARKGVRCEKKSRQGGINCSKHKKYEGKISKIPQTQIPKPKTFHKVTQGGETIPEEKKDTRIILRKNPRINKLWHSETNLIFKSASDRVVIAVYREGVISKLGPQDIENCKKYGFRYDEEEEEEEEKVQEVEEAPGSPGDKDESDEHLQKIGEEGDINMEVLSVEKILEELQIPSE